jgi:crotonobetainyl-CoA:carnitine CoA-transferase CaiB-like acyl-CoA transferase
LVDVKSPEGSIVLERLIKWADIIVYNGLDRQLKDLGIDWDSVKVINPKAIIIKINCWGGPKEGPRSNYTGYDDIVQASTGVMARFGGGLDTPEEHAHMGTIDVPSGFCACFSTMVGLYQRMRTGKGQMVYSSLAAVGQLIQVPFMYDYDGRGPFNEPSGPYVKGWNAVRRSYEAKDGWFFLSVVDSDIDKIETIPELNGIKSMSEKERVDFLSNTFKKDSVTNWVNKLKEIDIGAIAVGSLNGLRDEYTHDQDGKAYHEGNKYQFIAYDNHPSGRKVVITAPCAIRPDEAKIVASRPTEKYGSSTVEVMKTLGFGDDEIKNMIEAKAIGLSWSKDYLPD